MKSKKGLPAAYFLVFVVLIVVGGAFYLSTLSFTDDGEGDFFNVKSDGELGTVGLGDGGGGGLLDYQGASDDIIGKPDLFEGDPDVPGFCSFPNSKIDVPCELDIVQSDPIYLTNFPSQDCSDVAGIPNQNHAVIDSCDCKYSIDKFTCLDYSAENVNGRSPTCSNPGDVILDTIDIFNFRPRLEDGDGNVYTGSEALGYFFTNLGRDECLSLANEYCSNACEWYAEHNSPESIQCCAFLLPA